MSAKISIIVPIYKVEKYLDKCIQSIVDQTYSDLEIILVDDGSPDRCPEICDAWARRDSRIRVIHQKNGGLSAARNAGIRVAQGEYLYFLDSDDWIVPNLCERVMGIFQEHEGVDIVAFDCTKITESGVEQGGTESLTTGIYSAESALRELQMGHVNAYAWSKIYRRAVFSGIWFPARTFEDMAIAYKLFLNARNIYCLNEKMYYYVQRQGSITSRLGVKELGDLFQNRWESYVYLKPLYPDIAQIVFPLVTLCAIRLYDRFLWERGDEDVYALAMGFLEENRNKILGMENVAMYHLFFRFPGVYKALRMGKHYVGNTVRAVQRRTKRTV